MYNLGILSGFHGISKAWQLITHNKRTWKSSIQIYWKYVCIYTDKFVVIVLPFSPFRPFRMINVETGHYLWDQVQHFDKHGVYGEVM